MAEWPTVPPGLGVPLVDMETKRLPAATMAAIADSPELSAAVDGQIHDATAPIDAALTGRLSEQALNATIARASAWGSRTVLLGNSRFALEAGTSGTQQRGALFWANLHLGKRLDIVGYAGVSGDRLPQMIARYATDVASKAPDIVAIRDAVNDITNGATYADLVGWYTTLINLNRSIGAKTVLLTTTPKDTNDSGQNLILSQINRWVVRQQSADVLPVDVTSAVVSATGLTYRPSAATDGLHQSRQGAAREGLAIAAALDKVLPPRFPLPSAPDGGLNLVQNPFISDTPGHKVPTGYSVSPAQDSATTSYDVVARTDGVLGNWLQVTSTSDATATFVSQTRNIDGWAQAGDTIQFAVEMQSDVWESAASGPRIQVFFKTSAGANISSAADGTHVSTPQVGDSGDATGYPLFAQPGIDRATIFETPRLVVPEGCTQIQLIANAAVKGVIRWGRFGCYKL